MHGVHRAIAVQSAGPVQVMSAGSAYFLGWLAVCLFAIAAVVDHFSDDIV
jgi:hypothetical protein